MSILLVEDIPRMDILENQVWWMLYVNWNSPWEGKIYKLIIVSTRARSSTEKILATLLCTFCFSNPRSSAIWPFYYAATALSSQHEHPWAAALWFYDLLLSSIYNFASFATFNLFLLDCIVMTFFLSFSSGSEYIWPC